MLIALKRHQTTGYLYSKSNNSVTNCVRVTFVIQQQHTGALRVLDYRDPEMMSSEPVLLCFGNILEDLKLSVTPHLPSQPSSSQTQSSFPL